MSNKQGFKSLQFVSCAQKQNNQNAGLDISESQKLSLLLEQNCWLT